MTGKETDLKNDIKIPAINVIYGVILFVSAIALLMFGVRMMGLGRHDANSFKVRSFSDGWKTEDGREWAIKDIRAGGDAGVAVAYNTLPDDTADEDALCFETHNANVRILVGDREIYSFETRENLTGMGYGYRFHSAGLSAADAGKTVTLIMESVIPSHRTADMVEMSIAEPMDYMRVCMRKKNLLRFLSFLIICFGLIMLLAYLRASDRARIPFDACAFGITVMMIGVWLVLDTNMFQLVNGMIYPARIMNRMIIFFAGYPLIVFVNSLTRLRRRIYVHLAFLIAVCAVAVLLALRYLAGVDMIYSFSKVIFAYAIVISVLIVVIFVDNSIYCRANAIVVRLKPFYVGALILLGCCMVDHLLDRYHLVFGDSYGVATRVGLLTLIVVMMIRIFRWWTRDRAMIERDRLVNRILQYALSSETPDTGIRSMLEFLGTELKASRVMVFEDQKNGKYHGTYEWYAQGHVSGAIDLMYLPVKGFVDDVYKIMRSNDGRLIVKDIEDYRAVSTALYDHFVNNRVKTMVAGPLKAGDDPFGLLVWMNIPDEEMEMASELIGLVSYFMSQQILRRDEHTRLKFYSFNDFLTGVQNRLAYREYIEKGLDTSSSFGYLQCEISKNVDFDYLPGNDSTDRHVIDMASCLTEVFGKDRVFRVGGNEFVAFGFEVEEIYFRNDAERVRKLAAEKGLSPSIGAVYCTYGTRNIASVITRANELLHGE